MCKWILDGYKTVPAHELDSLLREIRGAVGMEHLDMDADVLGTLSNEQLSVVGTLIIGALTTVRVHKPKSEDDSKGLKLSNELVSFLNVQC